MAAIGTRFGARLGLTRADLRALGSSFVALSVSAATAIVAGLTLGAFAGTLEEHPGLLVFIPAAIALRGNVFGALGSRLGTTIHAGTFRLSRRLDTVVGQNVAASIVLTFAASLVLAGLASVLGLGFGLVDTISLADYIVISIVGGSAASVVVLGITLALASGSVRFGWDLDNVTAPLVTATGDVVTVPALVAATFLVRRGAVTTTIAIIGAAISLALLVWAVRHPLSLLRRIVRESFPVLTVAGLLSLVAGVAIEKRLDAFVQLPALLVLLPGYLGTAGALGGILSSRLSSKLHLGLVEARALPSRAARLDIRIVFLLAAPIFVLNALIAHGAAVLVGQASPGVIAMVGIAGAGGFLATCFVATVAYYGTIAAVRFGLDPDSYGIPLVTSSLDLVGAFTLILVAVVLGVI